MKEFLAIITVTYLLLATSIVWANYCGCYRSCAPAGPQFGCQCSDPGMAYNTCISKEVYCRAFGNIGKTAD